MEKHSRVMTKNLEASSTEDVFNLEASSNEDDVDTGSYKSFGVDPLKSNSPSTLDESSVVSLSLFSQVLPEYRKLVVRPLKRMSTYLRSNQCFKRRYPSGLSLLSELAVKGSKISGRCVLQFQQKYKVKDKEVSPERNFDDIINNDDLNLILPSDQLLPLDNEPVISKRVTHSDETVNESKLTTYQSTRSEELLPTFDISELNDLSTKRSLDSLDKVDSEGLDCLDSYTNLFKLLKFCGQDYVIGFEDVFDWSHTGIRKIGEGTYDEVFIITQKKLSSVIKVIPISDLNTQGPGIQPIENVYSELKITHCLSKLGTDENHQTQNFSKLKSLNMCQLLKESIVPHKLTEVCKDQQRSAKIVKGSYPSKLLVAWDTFSEAKATDNLRPDVFAEDQLYAIFELEYGGKDMTAFVMRNAAEAECIFQQVFISLTIAENACSFEHRNLCLENILVRRNSTKSISYMMSGSPFSIKNYGLVVTITDFSFSRALVSGCLFYKDFANEESLFNQSGDLKFDVYRATRELLNNEWQKSALDTNVFWLRVLCSKFKSSEYSRPTSKKHRKSMKSLRRMINILPVCASADTVYFASNIEVCKQ